METDRRQPSTTADPLRVLVYPHDLQIGGSQINAIEIAARLTRLGHQCILFGRWGPLVDRARDLGLEFVESPDPGRRPSLRVARVLASLVRERSIDIVHGYEWPPAIEAWLAARLSGAAAVGTVMSMAVAPFIPRSLPLLVGTEQIAAVERENGRGKVAVLEPPVDVSENTPSISGATFRQHWGISESETCLVCVTRLAHEMKLEGVLAAIRAVGRLALTRPVRLVVVGGGPATGEVRTLANHINADLGRTAVILTGELADPREAYAAADVVLGMGGSALRGMAFGKALVVQGESGFWKLLSPDSVDQFLWTGWYGAGQDVDSGVDALCRELRPLLDYGTLRDELGRFGRQLVEARFSLDVAADRQVRVYRATLALEPAPADVLLDGARSGVGFVRYTGARKYAKLKGRVAVDDFNSRPVLVSAALRARSE